MFFDGLANEAADITTARPAEPSNRPEVASKERGCDEAVLVQVALEIHTLSVEPEDMRRPGESVMPPSLVYRIFDM